MKSTRATTIQQRAKKALKTRSERDAALILAGENDDLAQETYLSVLNLVKEMKKIDLMEFMTLIQNLKALDTEFGTSYMHKYAKEISNFRQAIAGGSKILQALAHELTP